MRLRRREFILGGLALGAAAIGGGTYALGSRDDDDDDEPESVLAYPAKECPIDRVVVLMLENRSFDHYYGWLSKDEAYLEAGRSRYGSGFHIDARNDLEYIDASGRAVPTQLLTTAPNQPVPYRGCGHPIPGHGWLSGRVQRDHGFLAPGSGNDEFAVGYYDRNDLPVHARLAEVFTVFDHYHSSLLASTFPNRQYMHSAQSNGRKEDPLPLEVGLFQGPTIWDKLLTADVDVGYYYTDLPILLLWGEQYDDIIYSTDAYFEQAATGTLPNVCFVDPGFGPPLRTDDHPLGDVRLGQRFAREIINAFVQSPQWERGVLFLTYDEWGGFFDHVPPPILPDARSSPIDADNFGQAGFRVPAGMASPYARHGGVDHRLYDHTSILRFIEWRFLGAPPEGPGAAGPTVPWALTTRDRYAKNIGSTLRISDPEPERDFDAGIPTQGFSLGCDPTEREEAEQLLENSDPFNPSPEMADVIARRFPRPTETPWIEDEPTTDLPVASTPQPAT